MGSPHGRQWRAALIAPLREPYARVRAGENRGMTLTRQMTFWMLTFVVGVLVLYLLREILLPFVAGMALAYLLAPAANRLERMGVHRMAATLLLVGGVVLAFVVLLLLFVPIFVGQLGAFIDNMPGYVFKLQSLANESTRAWLRNLVGEGVADAQISDLVKQGAAWAGTFARSLWTGGQTLLSIFSLAVVTPVVAFYLLYDWNRMVAKVDSWVPLQHRETVHGLAREMDHAIAGFLRGQTAVCLILGSFYAVALTMTGLNFGLLIGLVSGLITFIPYVGSMTGLVLAGGVAVAQFWPGYGMIALVLGIFFVGQFIEGYVLQPKLVGESTGLHPVWLMFALFAFGYLFGFVGLLIAVPVAAMIGVLLRFALRRYLESSFYTGEPATGPVGFTSVKRGRPDQAP
jgi:predicted PurR-regulated permease PerM